MLKYYTPSQTKREAVENKSTMLQIETKPLLKKTLQTESKTEMLKKWDYLYISPPNQLIDMVKCKKTSISTIQTTYLSIEFVFHI